jgi:hypothetical protein
LWHGGSTACDGFVVVVAVVPSGVPCFAAFVA